MGLEPLEFSACLTDSPFFRENLHQHEKELERTSKAIKALINECKELLNAAKNLNKAQVSFAKMLKDFQFECIGSKQTDDEKIIAASLQKFGDLIESIEDERKRMLDQAYVSVIDPLESFRKDQVGQAKAKKKLFDKQTTKFCQSQERYLNLKAKGKEEELQNADATLDFERKQFYEESMKYVLSLQEVQERKKFEFVETLLTFTYMWLTFYHIGHEVAGEFKPYMTDLQLKLQKCRSNFTTTDEEAKQLMTKMLEKPQELIVTPKNSTREGYVYLMEKRVKKTGAISGAKMGASPGGKTLSKMAEALGTTWTKYYCIYDKNDQSLELIPYNQVPGKGLTRTKWSLTSCTRRASDSIEKRFCFDITIQDKATSLTLQAMSEEDRRLWLDVMDGKEPIYNEPAVKSSEPGTLLDDIGFRFIKNCISAIEERGLDDQGLYRVVGVNSKVNKLTTMGLDRRKAGKLAMHEEGEWEVKTITSALKNYFRSLPEPLLTYKLHQEFIAAAKQEVQTLRINDIHRLVHQLPPENFEMLDILLVHLKKVSENSAKNLMNVANIGVCFGPTLMRPQEETMAAIMDIKFCNIVVEILITNYEKILKTQPEGSDITETRVLNANTEVKPSPKPHRKPPNITVPSSAQHNANTVAPLPDSPAGRMDISNNSVPPPSASSTSSSGSFGSISGTPGYNANHNQGQTYAMARQKLRPVTGYYSQFAPEHQSSNSSSSESLNSKTSSHHQSNPTISTNHNTAQVTPPVATDRKQPPPVYSNLSQGPNPSPRSTVSPPSKTEHPIGSSSTSSISSISSTGNGGSQRDLHSRSRFLGRLRRVRTLYSCAAENESELSFEPNQIIANVRASREPGWLEGTLDGKRGLIPANYVEFLN